MPAVGFAGREPDVVNEMRLQRNGKEETLPGKFSHLLVHPGETLVFLTAGGSGYGDPAERDTSAVARDIALGYVTKERAGRGGFIEISERN